MGVHGLEPWTSSLSGTRSNQTELHARIYSNIEKENFSNISLKYAH